mgnify:CR=1 FL=1
MKKLTDLMSMAAACAKTLCKPKEYSYYIETLDDRAFYLSEPMTKEQAKEIFFQQLVGYAAFRPIHRKEWTAIKEMDYCFFGEWYRNTVWLCDHRKEGEEYQLVVTTDRLLNFENADDREYLHRLIDERIEKWFSILDRLGTDDLPYDYIPEYNAHVR